MQKAFMMEKKAKRVLATTAPLYFLLFFMGIKGLLKGVETHNMLRTAMSGTGLTLIATLYLLVAVAAYKSSLLPRWLNPGR